MRAWVCALLLSVLALLPLSAQCNFAPVSSTQFRATILDLAIDGNDLWAATSYGLTLYDRSIDPPSFVASIALPGTTRIVRAANGLAYAGSGSSIDVVRKNGRALQLVRSVDTGATVNDIIALPNDLYAATANGLLDYPLFDFTNPSTPKTIPTSSPNVVSLALINSMLYVADGDSSIEAITLAVPALPQSIGTMTSSFARPASLRTVNRKLYVSDGRSTELWSGSGLLTKEASYSFGATAVAQISGDALFAAGSDRTFRAFDLTDSQRPSTLFTATIPTSGGTVNRVAAMAATGSRLYVAAGDSGLLTYDTTSFAQPFPLRHYAFGATTSLATVGTHVYASKPAGGITEFQQSSNGTLVQQRSWDGGHADLVFDGGNGFLMTTSGASMTFWTTQSTIPVAVSTATFRAPVADAVLVGFTAYAVLSDPTPNSTIDRTLWSADLSLANPTPVQVTVSARPSSIARSGGGIAVADLKADGTTTVVYFADPTKSGTSISVPGVTTTPVALLGLTAAVFTFRGINLIDFATQTTTVFPQSGGNVARALALSGSSVLELTDSALIVWDRGTQRVATQYALPSGGSTMSFDGDSGSGVVSIGDTDGITSIAINGQTRMPSPIAATNANQFFKKVIASPSRVILFDPNGAAEIHNNSLLHTGTIRAAGMVDVAANANGTYVLFSNRTFGAYSIDGIPLRQTSLNDTTDTQPLAINAVGAAVWVSYARGCLTAVCEKRTNVYDASLNQTASFSGAVVDVTLAGNRAYAIVDLPSEVRAFDVTDALHPSQLATRATEGTIPNESLAVSGTSLYVLGEKLYVYDTATLTKIREEGTSFTADPILGLSPIDQHLRADGTCGVMTGRSFSATLLSFNSTIEAPPFGSPSTARFLAQQPGVFYILTDHSLEIWSTHPLPSLPRHHAAK